MHFQTFRLQPPHAPPSSGNASCSGRAWPSIRFRSLSAVLRTSLFARSLVSRIRPYRVCVAGLSPVSSTDCPFVSSCSPRPVPRTQLPSTRGGKHRHRETSTLNARSFSSARARASPPAVLGVSPNTSGSNVAGETPATATGTVTGTVALPRFSAKGCLGNTPLRRRLRLATVFVKLL